MILTKMGKLRLQRALLKIYVIFAPIYWISNYRSSKDIDWIILKIIESDSEIQEISQYNVKINGIEFWINNYPYAFGTTHLFPTAIPSRACRIMFRNYIFKKQADKIIDKISRGALK